MTKHTAGDTCDGRHGYSCGKCQGFTRIEQLEAQKDVLMKALDRIDTCAMPESRYEWAQIQRVAQHALTEVKERMT